MSLNEVSVKPIEFTPNMLARRDKSPVEEVKNVVKHNPVTTGLLLGLLMASKTQIAANRLRALNGGDEYEEDPVTHTLHKKVVT